MDIYFIRHGSTAGNLEHRYVGATDEPLTEGAKNLLKQNREFYPQPDCVFVSPLLRCVQTAGILFPEKETEALSGLRECGFGEFEYKNYGELNGDTRYQAWIDSGGTIPFPGGESREAFTARCCAAFTEACAAAEQRGNKSVAFVVHGGTIMAILDRFSEPHHEYFEWQVKNAEGFFCRLSDKNESEKSEWQERAKAAAQLCLTDIRPLPLTPGQTGIENQFVMKKSQKLRCGYTTGSCAAAAAKAAAQMLLSGRISYRADLMTPKGIRLHLPVEKQEMTAQSVSCAVRKYAGDDPDATDGILVYARAEYSGEPQDAVSDICLPGKKASGAAPASPDVPKNSASRIAIDGGIGVGRVTKPGLEQAIGEAAINRVPREMIMREVEAVCEEHEYAGRLKITISVPEGVEIAKRTFNPHLGIQGGISILGTSGIVVPMSEEALIASIRVEMKQKVVEGEQYILITPGNYGADFIRRSGAPLTDAFAGDKPAGSRSSDADDCTMDRKNTVSPENRTGRDKWNRRSLLNADDSMKCSNYVGETLDIARELGVKGILFVAHIGKFIKVSGGVMNTHSAHADCRAELIAAQAMRAGTPPEVVRRLLDTNTTEEAVGILLESGCLQQTMQEVTARIKYHLQKHCQGALETEAVIFSNQYGYLGETEGADRMIEKLLSQ